MSFLADIHFEIESEVDIQIEKEFRTAYLTVMSFLKFVDDGSGFSEKYLKERFTHRLEYRVILNKLISHSILKKADDGNYFLNTESKNFISPVFDNSLFLANINKNKNSSDPTKKFLYT